MFVKPTPLKRMTSRVVVDDNGGLVDLDSLDTSGIPVVPELDVSAITRRLGPERLPRQLMNTRILPVTLLIIPVTHANLAEGMKFNLQEGAVALDITREFPYDYSLLVENLADVGHVHFTHQCVALLVAIRHAMSTAKPC